MLPMMVTRSHRTSNKDQDAIFATFMPPTTTTSMNWKQFFFFCLHDSLDVRIFDQKDVIRFLCGIFSLFSISTCCFYSNQLRNIVYRSTLKMCFDCISLCKWQRAHFSSHLNGITLNAHTTKYESEGKPQPRFNNDITIDDDILNILRAFISFHSVHYF